MDDSDNSGATALSLCTRVLNFDGAMLLLEAGASPDGGFLHAAVRAVASPTEQPSAQLEACLRLAIERGADYNAFDDRTVGSRTRMGRNLLMVTINTRSSAAKLLLESYPEGIKPSLQVTDRQGLSPLLLAANRGTAAQSAFAKPF